MSLQLLRYGSMRLVGETPCASDVYANHSRWKSMGGGLRVLLTGANAGLGFFSSLALAESGAHVTMACRDVERGQRAMQAIRERVPGASLELLQMDTSDFDSVDRAVEQVRGEHWDAVVANAGVIHTPEQRQLDSRGVELVLSTNFLGHARLIGGLAAQFISSGTRCVSVGSLATWLRPIDPADLNLEQHYTPYRAYVQSKAALQAFAFGLDHRLKQLEATGRSIAVHPGYSISGLTPNIAGINEPDFAKRLSGQSQAIFAQGKHHGAVSIVEAVVNPGMQDVYRGAFLGPKWFTKGEIGLVKPAVATKRKRLKDPVWKLFVDANDGHDPFALSAAREHSH